MGSFNRSAKLSAATLDAWRLALEAIAGARLIVKNSSLDHEEERKALAARLGRAGIDSGRVELRGFSSHRRMLDEYNEVDIVLDTFPYNGGITTLEAMWMGKPVATIRGDTLISRQSAALLDAAGLGDLVARDAAHFARIVAGLAADPGRLGTLSMSLRERMKGSPLMDTRGMARALEVAYRGMWKHYLAAGPRRI